MISIQDVVNVATKGVKRKRGRPIGPSLANSVDYLLNHDVIDITDYYSLCQFLVKYLFGFTYILSVLKCVSEQGSEY